MKLSGVTESDYLELLTGYEILTDKKWSCEACVRTTDEATRKSVKGCFGGKHFSIRSGGKEAFTVDRCLGNYYTPSVGAWYRAYRQYQNGLLPFEGALLDQPAKALDVFSVFESIEAEKQEAARKNAESKAKRGKGGR